MNCTVNWCIISRVSSNVAVQSQLVLDDKEDDDVDDMFEVEPSFAPQPAADDLVIFIISSIFML